MKKKRQIIVFLARSRYEIFCEQLITMVGC